MLAGTDFFTAEVVKLRGLVTYYVLFFIHLESRKDCDNNLAHVHLFFSSSDCRYSYNHHYGNRSCGAGIKQRSIGGAAMTVCEMERTETSDKANLTDRFC